MDKDEITLVGARLEDMGIMDVQVHKGTCSRCSCEMVYTDSGMKAIQRAHPGKEISLMCVKCINPKEDHVAGSPPEVIEQVLRIFERRRNAWLN